MTTGRVLWLIWCLLWAGVWLVDGIRNIPHRVCEPAIGMCFQSGNAVALAVCLALAAMSAAAFLLPVGRPRKVPPPPYGYYE